MKANKEAIEMWKEFTEYGDMRKLAKLLNLTEQRAATIYKSGEGSVCQIATIHKYYLSKKIQLETVNKQINENE